MHCYQCAAYTNGASGGTSGGTAYRLLVGRRSAYFFICRFGVLLHFLLPLWPRLAALGGAGLALGSAGLCG